MTSGSLDALVGVIAGLDDEGEYARLDLRAAETDGDDVVLALGVLCGAEPHSDWRLTARGVAETSLVLGSHELVEEAPGHVLLLDHTDREEHVYIGTAPADPRAVLADVWAAHEAATGGFRPLSRYLNTLVEPTALLAGGFGLFAAGPATLTARYADVLRAHGCLVSVLDKGRPKRWDPELFWVEREAGDLTALLMMRSPLLGSYEMRAAYSWILAAGFEAVRLDGATRS